jgi:prepilin-type N-terminal cleavage/methylation domain-containing protein
MKGLTLQKSPLHQTAFTLIELLVVVGMISVLCSIGIRPSSKPSRNATRLPRAS